MKKFIILLTLIVQVITLHSSTPKDSLQMFLKFIGEDSMVVSDILSNIDADYRNVSEMYFSGWRLQYDSSRQKLEWTLAGDSCLIYRTTVYLTERIVKDTALYLIDTDLFGVFVRAYARRFDEKLVLECAKYAINHFYSRSALDILELYYYNHQEDRQWTERLTHYRMVKFVLSGGTKNNSLFETFPYHSLLSIIKLDDTLCPYYTRYRNLISKLSDDELARITEGQKAELLSILQNGIEQGDIKAMLTYSFILITGTFTEKDIETGQHLISLCMKYSKSIT